MNLEQIQSIIKDELAVVDKMLLEQLTSDVALINQIGHYILHSGGKRIRPIIVILAAHALQYQGQHHLIVALFVELIHTATLLHDDVVDASQLRRSRATANAIFGNAVSVLTGDFIYTRAFQLLLQIDSHALLALVAGTTNRIAEGEVMQLAYCRTPTMTNADYRQIISRKTACLFATAAQSGALLATANSKIEEALKNYGYHLGIAFQLINDLRDYSTEGSALGKVAGDDLDEGRLTLPLLHAMQHATSEQLTLIHTAIQEGGGRSFLEEVRMVMMQHGSLSYVQQCAITEIEKAVIALQELPQSLFHDALVGLAHSLLPESTC